MDRRGARLVYDELEQRSTKRWLPGRLSTAAGSHLVVFLQKSSGGEPTRAAGLQRGAACLPALPRCRARSLYESRLDAARRGQSPRADALPAGTPP